MEIFFFVILVGLLILLVMVSANDPLEVSKKEIETLKEKKVIFITKTQEAREIVESSVSQEEISDIVNFCDLMENLISEMGGKPEYFRVLPDIKISIYHADSKGVIVNVGKLETETLRAYIYSDKIYVHLFKNGDWLEYVSNNIKEKIDNLIEEKIKKAQEEYEQDIKNYKKINTKYLDG